MQIKDIALRIIEKRFGAIEHEVGLLNKEFNRIFNSLRSAYMQIRDAEEVASIINDSICELILQLQKNNIPDNFNAYCRSILRNCIDKHDESFANKNYLKLRNIIKTAIADLEKEKKLVSNNSNDVWRTGECFDVYVELNVLCDIAYCFEADIKLDYRRWTKHVIDYLRRFLLFLVENTNGKIYFNDLLSVFSFRTGIGEAGIVSIDEDKEEEEDSGEAKGSDKLADDLPNFDKLPEYDDYFKVLFERLDGYKHAADFTILYLHHFEDLSLNEVGERHRMPFQTVAYREKRVLLFIKKVVVELGAELDVVYDDDFNKILFNELELYCKKRVVNL